MLLCVFLSCTALVVVSAVLSTLTCDEGQVYVAITKQCRLYAAEESYHILDGSTVLKMSEPFANSEKRTDEYCLPATANNQYTFKLYDSIGGSGDSWYNGAWVSVAGIYGNVVFKNFMIEKAEETFALSLYYPVMKNAEWKMLATTSSVAADWNTVNFGESGWNAVTLGSAPAATGTQYFRKTFTGIANMAAYEYDMNYRYGIVVYVNGVEVFRDHMADGEVTVTTPSNGGFTDYEYHGVIRPAGEVTTSNNVFAVELHFPSMEESYVKFNAFVAALASTIATADSARCYVYPYDVTLTASGGMNAASIFDFSKSSYYNSGTATLPATVTYELGGPRAHVNSLRVWPYTYITQAPAEFSLSGAMSSSGTYSTVLTVTHATYSASTFNTFYGYFNAKPYQSYRLTLNSAVSTTKVYAPEVHLMVCSDMAPSSITFTPSTFSVYTEYEEVYIRPDAQELTGCTLAPALPAGLNFDAATCSVSGRATAAITATTFTMSVTMAGQSIQGTFSLEVEGCSASLVKILRSYSDNANVESFSIKDVATQQVVLSVAANSGQVNNQNWESILCLSGSKYEIDVGATTMFWQATSFLYVNAVLFADEYETVARIRYDAYQGLDADRIVNVQWAVAPHGQWFYKMGEVPANWYNSDTAGWNMGAIGEYTGATNQIQLYKKTFNVASLNDVAGFVISLRYLYGCVIYLNGHEAFRNGVTGDVTTSSVGLNAYTDLMYHQVSLPIKTLANGATPSVDYLQVGTNTIAVAIVAQTASQTTSYFDCALRLMGSASESRVFSYSTSTSGMSGERFVVLNQYYANTFYQTSCGTNYWMVLFSNNRREWISSITLFLHYQQNTQQPRKFTLKARNVNTEEWTTIKEVTGMTWSLTGEHKKIWLLNDKPYNQYRLENIGTGDSSDCSWKLSTLDFRSEYMHMTIPDLSYTTPIVITQSVEMGEIYPNSEYYFDFTVSPALPTGISIDPNTGKISGTCTEVVPATSYTIQATALNGAQKSSVVTISVEVCNGNKGFITLVAYTDSWPDEGSYKLFSGKGMSGQVVSSNTAFKVKNGLNYGDFCVAHNLYTVAVYDSKKDGWNNPAGWYLTIDVGALPFDMNQMPRGVQYMTTMFSSVIPFQIEYDSWKVWNKQEAVAADWTSVSFDDAAWETKKAAELGNHMGTTAYVRHEVNVPSLEDYHVLNVRVKYSGGVVAYFNGVKVARFNLGDNYDASTEATAAHDSSLFSKFHVILSTANAVAGKNVIAFEIHRAASESAVVFDASGIFGVNDCSIVLDTYSEIEGSEVEGCTKEDLLDILPTTYGHIPNAVDSYLTWTVENLEGSKANAFGLQTSVARTGYSFSIGVFWGGVEENSNALVVVNEDTKAQDRKVWSMPVGLAGFTKYKYIVDAPASDDVDTNAFLMMYCKAATSGSCPAVGEYSGVAEGEMSPAKCPEGFRGFAYRLCSNGQLGEVQTDKCEYKLPENMAYANPNYVFIMGTEVATEAPTYTNLITEFFIQEGVTLPEGFKIDATTGVISGIPTTTVDAQEFTVRGKNPKGETFAVITITVIKGYCLPDGVFDRTPVGESAVYQCSTQGSYVGTQKRACVLGKVNGEWQQATGFCMPVSVIVIVVLVVIVIIVVIVLIAMRSRKAKAVGGVKAKKGKEAKTMPTKKAATKTVKV